MPYCSYAHGNHRKYGNCFEKSLDNLLVKRGEYDRMNLRKSGLNECYDNEF